MGSVAPNHDHLTAILNDADAGDREALRQVVPLVYDELRALAGAVAQNGRPHTLQPTALVHEVFLRFSDRIETEWRSREHFFAVAAKVMRQLLADHARRSASQKRGGGWRRITVAGLTGPEPDDGLDVEALDRALHELDELDPAHARLVELRFLTGLDTQATAEALGVSPRTVQREWRIARAWLLARIRELTA